jgi:endonuclease/exonuclease/phosphatase family metal-dependent hydrolase
MLVFKMFSGGSRHALSLLAGLVLLGITRQAGAESAEQRSHGMFSLVTYNVAGLPEGMSTSHPSVNMPRIGKLLNNYDVALVQEDFAYADELRSTIGLAHATQGFERGQRRAFGDGLSHFARRSFDGLVREAWRHCHGIMDSYFDCLTPKGWSSVRQSIADGVPVDVYNLHMDAGDSEGDIKARASQIEQLVQAIAQRSADHAVIVAGDTNLSPSERDAIERFENDTGLKDVCESVSCPGRWRIDRVFYRSGGGVVLAPETWKVDRRFVDQSNQPLSDHLAVAVDFRWSIQPVSTSQTHPEHAPAVGASSPPHRPTT